MRIDEFGEIRRGRDLDIAILEGFNDVIANVFLFVAFSLGELELFNIVYSFLGSHYFGQLEDLIDEVVS